MGEKRDYYEVLDVERTADDDALKRAFRKVAMQYHPDRNPGDKHAEERFKEAAEAYEILCDPERRARYDRFGHAGVSGAAGNPWGGFGGAGVNDIFSEIFGDFFGGGQRAATRARGADLRYDLQLSFEEAAFGREVAIEFRRAKRCADCEGTGSASKKLQRCATCGGSGEVRFSQGFFAVSRTCSKCAGVGTIVSDPCASCRGRGQKEAEAKLHVKIPPGVDTGTRVRVQGEGEPGPTHGQPGDLYVVIQVREHPIFHREDADLICEVPVSFSTAALGSSIEIPTLDGVEKLKVPEGTQSGKVFHLKGKGVPRLQGRGRGDLHVRVVIETPQNLNSTQRELLRQFDESSGKTAHPRTSTFLDKVRELFQKDHSKGTNQGSS